MTFDKVFRETINAERKFKVCGHQRVAYDGDMYTVNIRAGDDEGVKRYNIMQIDGYSFVVVAFFHNNKPSPVVCDLSVSPQFRRKGYATRMMKMAEEFCRHALLGTTERLESIRLFICATDWRRDWFRRLGYEVSTTSPQCFMVKKFNDKV